MISSNKAIIWFRNDLRVHDNASLVQATRSHQQVLAVYCFDPRHFKNTDKGWSKTGAYRAQFLRSTVQALQKSLAQLNIHLVVAFEHPEFIIPNLVNDQLNTTLYYQNEWTSEEKQVETKVLAALPEIKTVTHYGQFLFHPEDVLGRLNNIPDSFTSFRKKVEKYVKVRPLHVTSKPAEASDFSIESKIPTLQDLGLEPPRSDSRTAFPFTGGESSALERLQNYLFETKKASYYKKTRNGLVGKDYSTKFSPWLANGSLSAKKIYYDLKSYEKQHGANESTYWIVFELLWRDFFKYVSISYNNAIFKKGGIQEKEPIIKSDSKLINRWISGTTSDDFVNANMLELKHTGWMSNRGRQNVASYFVHDLKQDWRIGARYFESLLLDYDVHSNYGNWMYVAGVGNNKRDSKFNTKIQANQYDEKHQFRALWLNPKLF